MPASPPAALPGLPPRASGTNQPLFPRLPPSLRLPAYPPARVSEEDALSAAAASSSRRISESETKAPGVSVRAGLRPDAAALDADACSCVKTVSPPAHTDAKSLGLSFRDASPRPPYAPRDRLASAASDTAVAPAAGDATPRAGAETGAYTGPDALAVSMFRAAVAAYLRARAAASRASRSCAAAISRSEGDAAVPGDGDPAAPGSPGIPGTTAPQLRGGAVRRASRAAAAAATAASPPPRATASSSAPERNRESPPRATRDAAASAAARREREDEPAGPSAIMRECGVGGSARLRAFATPRAVRASSQLTGYAHGTSFATLECSLASSLRSREGSAASSRAFVFAEFSFFFSSAPERRSEGNRRNVSVSFALETSPSVSARNAASASSLATRASASSSADHVSRTRRVSAGTPASASPPRSAKTASAFRVANRRQCAASASAPTLSANASSSNTERASQLNCANDVCASHRKEGTREVCAFRAFVLSVRSRFVLGSFFSSPAYRSRRSRRVKTPRENVSEDDNDDETSSASSSSTSMRSFLKNASYASSDSPLEPALESESDSDSSSRADSDDVPKKSPRASRASFADPLDPLSACVASACVSPRRTASTRRTPSARRNGNAGARRPFREHPSCVSRASLASKENSGASQRYASPTAVTTAHRLSHAATEIASVSFAVPKPATRNDRRCGSRENQHQTEPSRARASETLAPAATSVATASGSAEKKEAFFERSFFPPATRSTRCLVSECFKATRRGEWSPCPNWYTVPAASSTRVCCFDAETATKTRESGFSASASLGDHSHGPLVRSGPVPFEALAAAASERPRRNASNTGGGFGDDTGDP